MVRNASLVLGNSKKPSYNIAFGKSGADGRNLSSTSLINFGYGLTDPNPLAVLRNKITAS